MEALGLGRIEVLADRERESGGDVDEVEDANVSA